MRMSILFFTCADAAYEDFIPLYAFSVLAHVQNARLEVGVENIDVFRASQNKALAVIKKTFGTDRLKLTQVAWRLPDGRTILPNSVRFVNEPETKAEYVYIGDVDIIVLNRNLVAQHLKDIENTGLPYSNSVRPGTRRMSGLHFTRMDVHYPLPSLNDIDLHKVNDEMLLYEIVSRKKLPLMHDRWYRPTHGIHVSPNRQPGKTTNENGSLTPGWGIKGHERAWAELCQNPAFRELRTILSPRLRRCLRAIDTFCATGEYSDFATEQEQGSAKGLLSSL
jgi:hypothetical protein